MKKGKSKYDGMFNAGQLIEGTTFRVVEPNVVVKLTRGACMLTKCECGELPKYRNIRDMIVGTTTQCYKCGKIQSALNKTTRFNIGDIFGDLVIIDNIPVMKSSSKNVKRYKSWFLCECKCGTQKLIASAHLLNGNTISCGSCLTYKSVPGRYISAIRANANRRTINFDINLITSQYLWNMGESQNWKCKISGLSIWFEPTDKKKFQSTASLDRIDSSKGYVEGNLQLVHKDINIMKWDHTDADFIALCKAVATYNS